MLASSLIQAVIITFRNKFIDWKREIQSRLTFEMLCLRTNLISAFFYTDFTGNKNFSVQRFLELLAVSAAESKYHSAKNVLTKMLPL